MNYRASLKNLARRLNFRWGITRIVWLGKHRAYKFPNPFFGWANFVSGIIANLHEEANWAAASCQMEADDPHLPMRNLICPITWYSWGCWLVVMRRVERELTLEEFQWLDLAPWQEQDLHGDDKAANYGWLAGRVVKLDYGHFVFAVRWWRQEES